MADPQTNPRRQAGPLDALLTKEVLGFGGLWVVGLAAVVLHATAPENRDKPFLQSLFGVRTPPAVSRSVSTREDSTSFVVREEAPRARVPGAPIEPAAAAYPRPKAEPTDAPTASHAAVGPMRTFARLTQGLSGFAGGSGTSASAAAAAAPARASGLSLFVDSNRAEVLRAKRAQQEALRGGKAPAISGVTPEQVSASAAAQADAYNRGAAADPARLGGASAGAGPSDTGERRPGVNPQVGEKNNTYVHEQPRKSEQPQRSAPSAPAAGGKDDKAGQDCKLLSAINAQAPGGAAAAAPSRTEEGIAICRQNRAAALSKMLREGSASQADYQACMASCAL